MMDGSAATVLVEYAERCTPDDLVALTVLRAAVAEADPRGRVARSDWVAAVHASLTAVADHLGTHGASMLGGEPDELESFVHRRVLPELSGVGLAPSEDGALAFEPGVASEIDRNRPRIIERLDARMVRLEEERATRFTGSTGPRVAGTSRLSGEGLTKVYQRRRVVDDVHIDVSQSEIVGLLGPNGAGKTTTFYMLVGLIPPDAGKVRLDDDDLTGTPMYKRARKGVGYLAQEPSVFRKLTVEENVLAILETLGLPRDEERRRLEGLLRELGLQELRKSKAYALSGGERRRLEITRALVQRPKFLLLDEPFAGIDPIAVNDIQQIVRGLKERGIGVLISDHNVEQTLEIVDRAYIMYEGRIRVSGTVSELVWNDDAAEIYLGPTLTARMRSRYERPLGTPNPTT